MKTWIWVVIIAVVLAVSVTLAAVFLTAKPAGTIACVYVDGELVYRVDLALVEAPYRYTVDTPYGSNVLEIDKGRIRIVEADCPGQDCVEQGYATSAGLPLVCLPHRLVVKIEGAKDADSVSR